MANPPICTFEGCDKPRKAQGLCKRHYQAMRNSGQLVCRKQTDISRETDDELRRHGYDLTGLSRTERKKLIARVEMKRQRQRNPEKLRARYRSWLEANPDKAKAACDRWRTNNKERSLRTAQEWKHKNREAVREYTRAYFKARPEQNRAYANARRAARLKATPSWVDTEALRRVYLDCPDGMVVDHIYPLKGKNICGLHVPWNLQYLTHRENSIKGNRVPTDDFDIWLSKIRNLASRPDYKGTRNLSRAARRRECPF